MRDKALKKKLQQLHIPQYDEYKLEKVIVEAKKIDLFSGNQRMTNTEFFLNQLGFISKKVWSLKAFFSISILYLILAKDVYSNNWVMLTWTRPWKTLKTERLWGFIRPRTRWICFL